MNKYELETSLLKDAVWIHCSDGSTVGRFGKMGVDLHNSITEQMAGAGQCRLCTHGRVSKDDWQLFIDKALEFWSVVVPVDAFNSKYLKG